MQDLSAVLDQLKKAGITPQVEITLAPENLEAQQIVQLHANLKKAGITPVVHIHVQVSTAAGQAPPQEPDPAKGPTFMVVVTSNKLNCMEFKRRDAAGKPIMEIHEPRVQLFSGARFAVSATAKLSDKDSGNGTIIGTGGIKYYQVSDCPPNRTAEGFFIKQDEVSRVGG